MISCPSHTTHWWLANTTNNVLEHVSSRVLESGAHTYKTNCESGVREKRQLATNRKLNTFTTHLKLLEMMLKHCEALATTLSLHRGSSLRQTTVFQYLWTHSGLAPEVLDFLNCACAELVAAVSMTSTAASERHLSVWKCTILT